MSELSYVDFPLEKIKLNMCYRNLNLLKEIEERSQNSISLPKVDAAIGPVLFPRQLESRPYTVSCIVLSSDGKMSYSDFHDGPTIAKNNYRDPNGALADFWILNVLRAYCDGVIIGARTIQCEPNMTSHVFDRELADERVKYLKKTKHPLNIVVSFDGTDIPFHHKIFHIEDEDFPTSVATSQDGMKYISKKCGLPHFFIGPYTSIDQVDKDEIKGIMKKNSGIPVFVTGEQKITDTRVLLAILKALGIKLLAVESPSYTGNLINMGLLDEYIINYSMVFAGSSITPMTNFPFNHNDHPHADLVTLGTHKANFIYTRQKLLYGLKKETDLATPKY